MSDEPSFRPKMGRLFSRGVLLRAVSLPLLVAAVWGALVLLTERHRSLLIAQLSDVAAHGNTREAAAAVRQLSLMQRPPVELLVAAATSPTRGVALEAQTAINDLVQRWHGQVKAGGKRQRVAGQLPVLIDALARQQPTFSMADYPWLGRVTRRILRLANMFPVEISLPVASQCELILANIGSADAGIAVFTPVSPALPMEQSIAAALTASPPPITDFKLPRSNPQSTGSPLAAADDPQLPAVRLAEQIAMTNDRVASEALDSALVARPRDQSQRAERLAGAGGRSEVAFVPVHPVTDGPIDRPAPDSRRISSSEGGLQETNDVWSLDAESGSEIPTSAASAQVEDGSRPRSPNPLRQVKIDSTRVDPRSVVPDVAPRPDDAITPVVVAPGEEQSVDADAAPASLDTRTLLTRWLVADATAALELERELARRGFGRLPTSMVEQLLSPDAASRRSLVADLLAQPGVDARPWLILLSRDEEADVRLAAISTMATSNDPQLIEAAWQAALHDRDPRIADLAPRLRARQAALQQR